MKNDKMTLLKFMKYMKFAKKEYIFGIGFMLVNTITLSICTYYLSKVFDKDYSKAIYYLKIVIFLTLIASLSDYIKKYYLVLASNKLYEKLQEMIYKYMQMLPIKYYDNIATGSVISVMINDVVSIKDFFSNTFVHILNVLLKLLSIYIILLIVDYRMFLLLLIFLVFMLCIKKIYEKISLKYSIDIRKSTSKCSGIINESLQNLDIIRIFNNEENIINEWRKESLNKVENAKKLVSIDARLLHNLTQTFRDLLFVLVILMYGISKYSGKEIVGISMVYLFIRYTLDVIDSVTNLVITLSSYSKAVGAANNINELLKLEIEEEVKVDVEDLRKDFKANILFENVSFSYDNKNLILDNISFEIKENEMVAFVGRTGSGKSTIINLLSKFYENQSGNIYINGKNLKDISRTYLRNNISIVLQDSFLFEGSICENILINSNDEEKAKKILEYIGADFILKNGKTINSKIDVNASNFSSGEKQLLSFARAIAKNPSLIILDEATSNIDSETEKYIQESIKKMSKNRTTIIIAHRLSTIKEANKIFVLDKGKIVESGTHNELIAKEGIYFEMYNKQK